MILYTVLNFPPPVRHLGVHKQSYNYSSKTLNSHLNYNLLYITWEITNRGTEEVTPFWLAAWGWLLHCGDGWIARTNPSGLDEVGVTLSIFQHSGGPWWSCTRTKSASLMLTCGFVHLLRCWSVCRYSIPHIFHSDCTNCHRDNRFVGTSLQSVPSSATRGPNGIVHNFK